MMVSHSRRTSEVITRMRHSSDVPSLGICLCGIGRTCEVKQILKRRCMNLGLKDICGGGHRMGIYAHGCYVLRHTRVYEITDSQLRGGRALPIKK